MSRSGLAAPPAAERRDGPAGSVGRDGGNHVRGSRRKIVRLLSACASLLAITGLASAVIGLRHWEQRAKIIPAQEPVRGRHQPPVAAGSRSVSPMPPIFGLQASVLLFAPTAPAFPAGRTTGPAPAPRTSPRGPAPRVSPSVPPGRKPTPFLPSIMPINDQTGTPSASPTGSGTPSPNPAGSGTPSPNPTGSGTPSPNPTGNATPSPRPD